MKKGEPTRADVALSALADVRKVLDEWTGSDWSHTNPAQEIDHILHLAYAKLRMQSMRRERRPAAWLAQPVSAVWPQEIAWYREREPDTALCFEVRITDGTKDAIGRRVEVRMSANDADFLAMSMKGMAEWGKGKPGPADILNELLPGGSSNEEDST